MVRDVMNFGQGKYLWSRAELQFVLPGKLWNHVEKIISVPH